MVAVSVIAVNVTDRRRAEAALRESEERYRTLAETTTDVIYILDEAGKLLYVNRTAAAYFGVSPEALIGKTQQDLFPPEQVPSHLEHIHQVFETGEMHEMEARYRFGPSCAWLNVRTIPLRDGQGRVTSAMGVCRNVTEQKRAEDELQKVNEQLEQRVRERTAELTGANERLQAEVEQRRQSEAKYRALVESSPDAVVMVDLRGQILFASQRAADLHGFLEPGDMVGRPAVDFLVAAERNRAQANILRLIAEGEYGTVEHTLVRADGTTFQAEMSAAVIRDAMGNAVASLAVYRDITKRKQVENRLAMLGRFVEAATQGFGMADLQQRITYVNRAMATLLGEERPEDVLGNAISTYHSDEYTEKRIDGIRLAIDRDGYWQGELALVRRDGTVIPTLHNIFSVRDMDGSVDRFAVMVTDISGIKQAEAKLKAEHHSLRRMLLASDHERRLITYELHDGAAQEILGAKMLFESQQPVKGRKSKAANAYREGMEALQRASTEIRRVMNWLRNSVSPISNHRAVGQVHGCRRWRAFSKYSSALQKRSVEQLRQSRRDFPRNPSPTRSREAC